MKTQKGLTLVELLVTLAIVSVMAAGMMSVGSYFLKASDGKDYDYEYRDVEAKQKAIDIARTLRGNTIKVILQSAVREETLDLKKMASQAIVENGVNFGDVRIQVRIRETGQITNTIPSNIRVGFDYVVKVKDPVKDDIWTGCYVTPMSDDIRRKLAKGGSDSEELVRDYARSKAFQYALDNELVSIDWRAWEDAYDNAYFRNVTPEAMYGYPLHRDGHLNHTSMKNMLRDHVRGIVASQWGAPGADSEANKIRCNTNEEN